MKGRLVSDTGPIIALLEDLLLWGAYREIKSNPEAHRELMPRLLRPNDGSVPEKQSCLCYSDQAFSILPKPSGFKFTSR